MLRRGSKFDRYTIEDVLGEGGMGTVYRAYDARLQRAVALKLLRPAEGETDERGSARLLREARAAAALGHANAVAIYDVGQADGVGFIAMELVEGRSLRALVGSRALPMATRVGILTDVARALHAAHARGLIHRDIKPENVMIAADGAVKVLDFGLARALRDDTPSSRRAARGPGGSALETFSPEGAIVGTPRYMAPEQLRGESLDARTDQFSWGVLAYELLTGQPPWPGETASLTLVSAIQFDEPPPPEAVEPEVPPAVAAVVVRALAKEPGERFGSMAEVVAALGGSLPAMSGPDLVVAPGSARTVPTQIEALAPRRDLRLPALALLAVGVGAAWGALLPGATGGPESTLAAASAPTSLIDAPAIPSEIPEARAAYAAGLHALHEGSLAPAASSFARAAELDPAMAAAHLRLALWAQYDPASHEHFARAREQNARLSERDRALLQAIEPWYLATPPDEAEVTRRTQQLADRFPLDAEMQLIVGIRESDPAAEIAAYERVLALDAQFGLAYMRLTNIHLLRGDYGGALASLDRCLAETPSSAGCLSTRASVYEELGRCAEMERDARLLASTSPSMRAHDWVARALYGTGAPAAAVHGALSLKWAAGRPEQRAAMSRGDEAHLAILRGDLAEAERLLRALAAEAEHATDEDEHAVVVAPLVELLLEMGEGERAAALADQYLSARSAWRSAGAWSPLPEMLAIAVHGGKRREPERREGLAAWRRLWDNLEGPLHLQAWVIGSAIPATTPADAEGALRDAPEPLPRVHSNQFHREGLEAIGRVLLLAGRAADAVPYLRRSAASCAALQVPLEHTQAHLHLGQALEATGDAAGACQAYRVVLDRWGAARPRSLSADRARARARALGCR